MRYLNHPMILSYKDDSLTKPIKTALKIRVDKTESEKAVKMKTKGKIDALMGGSMFLTPTVKGYAGNIEDVRVDSGDKTPEFEALWSGGTIELITTYDYEPSVQKREVKLIITMSTGRELPYIVKITPNKGKLALKVYDAVVKVPEKASEGEEPKVYTPVIATYTYKYYTSPKTVVNKIYTIDLTTDNGKLFAVNAPELADDNVTAAYENGVITLTGKGSYKKDKNVNLKISAKWNLTGKVYNARCNVTVEKAD